MTRWAGFDTTDFTSDPPRSAATWPNVSTCNPQGQNLALYTANHYAGRTPTSKYFGRYFLTPPGISPFNASAEVTALRTATFFYILPIAAPDQARQTMDNMTGKTYGVQDANTTINNMIATRPYGVVPGVAGGANTVYVFLDVESGVPMSAWYWEGWSETIYNYSDGTWGAPFWPCVYASPSTVVGSTDKATMDMLVGYISRSDTQHSCKSLWTTQPSYQGTDATTCGYSTNNPGPTWDLTAGHPKGYAGLVVGHWQYTLDGNFWAAQGCNIFPTPSQSCCDACRPHVDNDQSSATDEMTNYMLRIT